MFWTFTTLFLTFLHCHVHAKQVAFTDCGSQNGHVVAVDITPCDSEPCIFARGETVSVEIDFISSLTSTDTAELTAFTSIFGEKIQLELTEPNACLLPGTSCPIKNGVLEKPVEQIKVPSDAPSIFFAIPLQVYLTGDNKENIFCGEIKIKLK